LFALRQAVAAGADAIELDVHRSADGELIVCHDSTIDRTTPGVGRICDLTLEELRAFDNAFWWVPGFESTFDAPNDDYILRGRYPTDRSLGIATLDEVLTEFPNIFLNFDIKDTSPSHVPYETQLADILRAYGRTTDVIVASFHDSAIKAFRSYAPEIHTSMSEAETLSLAIAMAKNATPDIPDSVVAVQVPMFFMDTRVVTTDFVTASHRLNLAVHVWTIDEPEEMLDLLSIGVDAIMTDCPSVLREVADRFNR
jgi:glycerophosphoryl diester phosphodiesterase